MESKPKEVEEVETFSEDGEDHPKRGGWITFPFVTGLSLNFSLNYFFYFVRQFDKRTFFIIMCFEWVNEFDDELMHTIRKYVVSVDSRWWVGVQLDSISHNKIQCEEHKRNTDH